MRRLFVLVTAGLLCLTGAAMAAVYFFAAETIDGYTLRDINGTDLYGKELRLSDNRGKVVLLVFWDSSGRDQAPALQLYVKALQEKFEGQPFVVVGVNGDYTRAMGKWTSERARFDFRSFQGGRRWIDNSWRVRSYPTLFLLDRRGNIDRQYYDLLGREKVEQDALRLLQTAEQT